MNELDVWLSAQFFIQQHGDNAVVVAVKRAVELVERDNEEDAEVSPGKR